MVVIRNQFPVSEQLGGIKSHRITSITCITSIPRIISITKIMHFTSITNVASITSVNSIWVSHTIRGRLYILRGKPVKVFVGICICLRRYHYTHDGNIVTVILFLFEALRYILNCQKLPERYNSDQTECCSRGRCFSLYYSALIIRCNEASLLGYYTKEIQFHTKGI